MRHRVVSRKFGKSSAHRDSMLAQMACSLIEEKRIVTTLCRAKALRSMSEKMVTSARSGALSDRRKMAALLRKSSAVKQLFEQIAPQFKERSGGYTRIVRIGARRGDNAEMALLEWVGITPPDKRKKSSSEKSAETK